MSEKRDPSQSIAPKVAAGRRERAERIELAKIDSPEIKTAAFAAGFMAFPINRIKAYLDVYPDEANLSDKELRQRSLDMLYTPQVQKLLEPYLDKFDEQKSRIFTHLLTMALNTEDPVTALGAIDRISKICGWFAPVKVETSGKTLNIHQIFKDPDAVSEALALMSHEPGAATAIPSDARTDHEKRRAKFGVTIDAEEVE